MPHAVWLLPRVCSVTHSLTLILFTRTLIRVVVPDDGSPGADGDADVAGVQSGTLADGTPFEDFVQVCARADYSTDCGLCDNSMREKDWR
jgi:hypothetical protein